jgi:hypothetical protein
VTGAHVYQTPPSRAELRRTSRYTLLLGHIILAEIVAQSGNRLRRYRRPYPEVSPTGYNPDERVAECDIAMTVRRNKNEIVKTRFTFFLTAPQHTAVCEDATRLGISAGEIGRRILDNWLEPRPRNEMPHL